MAFNFKNMMGRSPQKPESSKDLRDMWGSKVTASYDFLKKRWKEEAMKYIRMYKHEFAGVLPERLLTSDGVDANIVFQVVKTLIPNLYFRDPKVFAKALQKKIYKEVTDEMGNPIADPITGEPLIEEYDAVMSAKKLESAINHNIKLADLKYEAKDALLDAELGFYGAIKSGWGNDQGVASMGEGAPPSIREEVNDNYCYGIRLKPWKVVVDMNNFYNPAWMAVYYSVHPSQLKNDPRFKNTEGIKGSVVDSVDGDDVSGRSLAWKSTNDYDSLQTEYCELYVKPCAQYPQGKFFVMTDEVKDDFLFEGDWPHDDKTFPIKVLYFNRDPFGGLPIPPVRYYANQQKAKINLRNAEYEYVQRIMPIMGIDITGIKNQATVEKQITAGGAVPRVVMTTRNPDRVFSGVSFPSLPVDFRAMGMNLDVDIGRVTGLPSINQPEQQHSDQLATGLKIAAGAESVRQTERADVFSDFILSIINHWAGMYQQYAGPENYSLVEGEKFPTKWSRDEINGRFHFEIKPFSMNYEDPTILRRQLTDVYNLLISPESQNALANQGASANLKKVLQRILETFQEPDYDSFIIDNKTKPEEQVADAIQENQEIMQGLYVKVEPTDNDKLHIIIHGLLGDTAFEHIQDHVMSIKMKSGQPASPGGGNAEGLPTNGVASSQGQIREPLAPSTSNKRNAIQREATDTR